MAHRIIIAFILLVFTCFQGCAVNPVTGKNELHIIPEAYEKKIGSENYFTTQQSQGGEFMNDPELTTYVSSVGQRLVKVSDRQSLSYEFVVLNNSVPNAWALPGGKIAVNRGLLVELDNEAELAAVLGHEIVHAAARHGAKSIERGILLQAGMVGVGMVFSENQYANLIVGVASIGAVLVNSRYTRRQESESDLYGMEYMHKAGYDPKGAVDLQRTFLRLQEGKDPDWLSGMFASHPPSRERLNANIATASTLASGGEIARERYQSKISRIKRAKPAYDALEEGQKALTEGNTNKAMKFANEAIRIGPGEAMFYEFKADVNAKENRMREAVRNYDQAISKNSRFFRFFLKRGLVKEKIGDIEGARHDLEKSNSLLPTASAYNSLGNFAQARGQNGQAISLFRMAAGSNSDVGRAAGMSLTRLELPQKPEKYISVGKSLNKEGFVVVSIRNKSMVSVKNVTVAVTLIGQNGKVLSEKKFIFRNKITPNKRINMATPTGPLTGEAPLRRVRARITRADIAN